MIMNRLVHWSIFHLIIFDRIIQESNIISLGNVLDIKDEINSKC